MDARAIRNRLLANFEQSLEPGLTKDERSRLLHTVIVGGGPTGVEFGAELHDFCQEVHKSNAKMSFLPYSLGFRTLDGFIANWKHKPKLPL